MAPSPLIYIVSRQISFAPDSTKTMYQWQQPGDAFSVLLVLGGDVVARAMAQVAGSGPATVAFSFGWVAYSISALMSAFGENRLMAVEPDHKCLVINAKSGYKMDNSSWIIGRLVRDFPHWKDAATQAKLRSVLKQKHSELRKHDPNAEMPSRAGLIVSVYKPSAIMSPGKVKRDLIYWIGVPIMILQLGIAAIPCGYSGDWGILMITLCGIVLSIATSMLPQWKREKWACRTNAKYSYVLTSGNGAQHAIVILGNGLGFDFESLASGNSSHSLCEASHSARFILLALAILWIALLVTAASLKRNTWFLLAVGGIGILQNVYVASAQRVPESFGVPLEFVTAIGHHKVMETLFQVERQYKDLGRSMLDTFFPGQLREDEQATWADIKAMWAERSANEKEVTTQK